MRGRQQDRKIAWFSRSRSTAGETERQRRISQAREEAETRKIELENEKIAGEIAQQPQQARQLESQSEREEAETRGIDFNTLRDQALLLVFLLMIILILALAVVNPAMLKTLGAGGLLVAVLSLLGYRRS